MVKKEIYSENALWDNTKAVENSLAGKNNGGSGNPKTPPHRTIWCFNFRCGSLNLSQRMGYVQS